MPKKTPPAEFPKTVPAIHKAAADVTTKSRDEISDLADRIAGLLTANGMKYDLNTRSDSVDNLTTSLVMQRALSDINLALKDRVVYRLMLAGRK